MRYISLVGYRLCTNVLLNLCMVSIYQINFQAHILKESLQIFLDFTILIDIMQNSGCFKLGGI